MPKVSSHRRLTPTHSKTTVEDTTNMAEQEEEMVDRQEAVITEVAMGHL